MRRIVNGIHLTILLVGAYALIPAQVSNQAHWPQWRGPFFNGMARGDAPTNWSDTSNRKSVL